MHSMEELGKGSVVEYIKNIFIERYVPYSIDGGDITEIIPKDFGVVEFIFNNDYALYAWLDVDGALMIETEFGDNVYDILCHGLDESTITYIKYGTKE